MPDVLIADVLVKVNTDQHLYAKYGHLATEDTPGEIWATEPVTEPQSCGCCGEREAVYKHVMIPPTGSTISAESNECDQCTTQSLLDADWVIKTGKSVL